MDMGSIAVPASQQHMTAGFMLLTMEDVVLASRFKFFFVDAALLCLDLFQSMFTKIMFATAVLCDSVPLSSSVQADHANDIALLVKYFVKRKLKLGTSKCLSRSLQENTLHRDGMIATVINLCVEIPSRCLPVIAFTQLSQSSR